MLEANWIEKCNSPWSFPIMGVPKPGKTQLRIVSDYRKLNQLLVLPRFPIPHPSTLKYEIMHSIAELKQFNEPLCFTIIDIKSAFEVLNLKKEDRAYTSFVHHNTQYEFKKVVQGIKSSPAIFCQYIDSFMNEVNTEYMKTKSYVDDFFNVCIQSKFIETVDKLLKSFIKYGITI